MAPSAWVWLDWPISRAICDHVPGEGRVGEAGVSQGWDSGPGTSQYKMKKGKKTGNPVHSMHLIVQEKFLLGRAAVAEVSNSCWAGELLWSLGFWDSSHPSQSVQTFAILWQSVQILSPPPLQILCILFICLRAPIMFCLCWSYFFHIRIRNKLHSLRRDFNLNIWI